MTTIALFGGTFDPPHIGHVEVVVSIIEQQLADEVWVVPVRQNPLKTLEASPPSVRRAMVDATFGALPKTRIMYDELELPSLTYTIDTIRLLKRRYSDLAQSSLFFVVGSDAFAAKNQWKEIDELEKELTFLVVQRQGIDVVPSRAAKSLPIVRLDVSSSLIRTRVKQGHFTTHFVHPVVDQIIKTKQLYV